MDDFMNIIMVSRKGYTVENIQLFCKLLTVFKPIAPYRISDNTYCPLLPVLMPESLISGFCWH